MPKKLKNTNFKSRSTWACELKLVAGAGFEPTTLSRSTWACELKFSPYGVFTNQSCHAPRERVSWNLPQKVTWKWCFCHAPRERVSWNGRFTMACSIWPSHAPRERVSWNMAKRENLENIDMSRSTWACELKYSVRSGLPADDRVTLHVSVWVEILVMIILLSMPWSRSTWACELKFTNLTFTSSPALSRSTWACELKWKRCWYG